MSSKTKSAFEKIANEGISLGRSESRGVFDEIMSGNVDPSLLGAFLSAMKMKGESVDEIVGAAQAMRARAAFINAGGLSPLDTCGTGGGNRGTFNISTTCAFIASGAGVCVAKHGNRAVASKCGSGDVLAELGFNLDVHPAVMEHCLQENGIAFLFAQKMHPAMKHAAAVRRALGVRTIFNILGPLVNPAGATAQVIGVFEPSLTEMMAECLRELGVRRAYVVHGDDDMDEISIYAPTRVSELREGRIKTYEFEASRYVDCSFPESDIDGGDARVNAEILRGVLENRIGGGAREICVINSAAAIVAAGLAESFEVGVKMARESIDSGAALSKLEKLLEFSNQGL